MDQESNQMEQQPQLCRNGCGFFSNNGTDGLCSVCYKDMIKKKQQPPTNMPASLVPTPAPGTMASLSIDESSASSEASSPAKNSSVDTALPTVILPSSQTDKVRMISQIRGQVQILECDCTFKDYLTVGVAFFDHQTTLKLFRYAMKETAILQSKRPRSAKQRFDKTCMGDAWFFFVKYHF